VSFFPDNSIKVKEIHCGGIYTSVLTQDDELYNFGCGSDGRLGHPEAIGIRVLYKESIPRKVDALGKLKVTSLSCSYYHCICCADVK
jgi:regulator of chromosome condensation